jgi:tetratricopeptide (TPR) repeat protein
MPEIGWNPLSRTRIAELTRDQFEDLCFLLLRREFGDELQRVEDRLGSGNGLDAVILREDVIGFQIRCYDPQNAHRFGSHHKDGVIDSIRKARAWSQSLSKRLVHYSLICNVDLQPGEFSKVLNWFVEVEDSYGLTTDFRPLLWVYDALLRAPRTIREEFFGPSPSDIGEQLSRISTVQIEQGKILEAIQEQLKSFALKSQTESIAVQRLIKEAQIHYSRAREKHDAFAFKDAAERARDAQRLLEVHWEDEPLFADITYILAMCLAGMGAWKEAATQFDSAEKFYQKVDNQTDAIFARGNAARMRRDVAGDDTGLETFLELYEIWELEGSLYNILASILNIGNCYQATHRELLAISWYSKGLEHIEQARHLLSATEWLDYVPAFLQLWGSLGTAAQQIGNYKSAREAYDAVESSMTIGDKLTEVPEIKLIRGQNLVNRATLSIKEKRWKEALEDAKTAENVLQQFQDYRSLGNSTYNKGEALLRLGDPTGADKAFKQAAHYFKEISASLDEADALVGRGNALEKLGLDGQARELYNRAKKLRGL